MSTRIVTVVAGGIMIFVPELLSHRYHYARQACDQYGTVHEVSDRWELSLLYMRLAASIFTSEVAGWQTQAQTQVQTQAQTQVS